MGLSPAGGEDVASITLESSLAESARTDISQIL